MNSHQTNVVKFDQQPQKLLIKSTDLREQEQVSSNWTSTNCPSTPSLHLLIKKLYQPTKIPELYLPVFPTSYDNARLWRWITDPKQNAFNSV